MRPGVVIAVAAVVLLMAALVIWLRLQREVDPDPPRPDCSSEELWASLEQSGLWLALESPPSSAGEVLYLEPRRGDTWIFPVFSSSELALGYLAAIAPTYERRVATPESAHGASFPLLQVTPEFLATNDWQPGQIVLNPESTSERVFSEADHAYFRSQFLQSPEDGRQ